MLGTALDLNTLRAFEWADPKAAWLALALAFALLFGVAKYAWGRRWTLPLAPGEKPPRSWSSYAAGLPMALRLVGLALLLIALMRPQRISSLSETSQQGRDIYLALDVSGSMQTSDLRPNRISAAKATLKHFVDTLAGDRVGLVVFAGKAFTQCPLSLDRDVVKYFIDQVDIGTVGVDGTAIGDGLLLAVQRLISEPKRGQVIVLATDGRSNTGQPPMLAAQVAAKAGIRLYTIGMGAKGGGIMTGRDPFGRLIQQRMEEPDEALMTAMRVEAEYLAESFAVIRAAHGSLDGYLEEALGVDAALRSRLHQRLLG